MKKNEKLFIEPLTPSVVNEEIYSLDDVYFSTFNLITQKMNKKTKKKIIRDAYKEKNKHNNKKCFKKIVRKKCENLNKKNSDLILKWKFYSHNFSKITNIGLDHYKRSYKDNANNYQSENDYDTAYEIIHKLYFFVSALKSIDSIHEKKYNIFENKENFWWKHLSSSNFPRLNKTYSGKEEIESKYYLVETLKCELKKFQNPWNETELIKDLIKQLKNQKKINNDLFVAFEDQSKKSKLSDLIELIQKHQILIIEINKILKIREIKRNLNNFLNSLTKKMLEDFKKLEFIEKKCDEMKTEANYSKQYKIIEEIKNNELEKNKKNLNKIKEINCFFSDIFKKLIKNPFLNFNLCDSIKLLIEQEKKIQEINEIYEDISNTLEKEENLIKINEIYEKAKKKWSFYNDVNNIALTGIYGSGKSSIINTYLNKHPELEKDVIRITLTHFSYSKKNNSEKKRNECTFNSNCSLRTIKENAIEEEIISELVYQIDPKNIYLSQYKIKKNIKVWLLRLLQFSSFLLFWLYLFLLIYYFPFKPENVFIFSPLMLPIFPTIYMSLKYKSGIARIKFLNKIDIDFKKEKWVLSKFDKEYRELVYIIKNSKKRIIIFEDLDRLENFEFLTKLRKINDILNRDKSSKAIRFKFFYVLKDNLFQEPDDKTKFFDLVIPIVPFKNTNNIKNIFNKFLSEHFENDEMITDISNYIDDNRLAISICNEFNIYLKKIKSNFSNDKIDLNMDNFFILIVFKNIFPELFNSTFLNKKREDNNKNNLLYDEKEIKNEKYKKLCKKYYDRFNSINYDEFYIYTSDYLVEESDRNWLVFLNKPDEKFDETKHKFKIKDWNYVMKFLNVKILKEHKEKEIEDVVKNVDFISKILFKLNEDNNLSEKENELIFDYFLKNEENSRKVLIKFFNENGESEKFNFNFLINFFKNIVKNNFLHYKQILFNIFNYGFRPKLNLKENIIFNLKIAFLSSLIFYIQNNREGTLFEEKNNQFFNGENNNINRYEKDFLLFLNANEKYKKKIILNDKFWKSAFNLYEKDYMKDIISFIEKEDLFLFGTEKKESINIYYNYQKYFLEFFCILNNNVNRKVNREVNRENFNYGSVLLNSKSHKNLSEYYFDFIINNFIYFLADAKSNSNNFFILENKDIILKILNSNKLEERFWKIYINEIDKKIIEQIYEDEINDNKIKKCFKKRPKKFESMILLDSKKTIDWKTFELGVKIHYWKQKPVCVIIQVGDLFESNKYVANKIKKAQELGVEISLKKFDDSQINQNDLINYIQDLINSHPIKSHLGIIVQLPLPSNFDKQLILDAIGPSYDIYGLSTANMNHFYQDKKPFMIPATAKAILTLLKDYKIELENKKMMVIGESNLVGKPIKYLLEKYSNDVSSRNINTGIYRSETADILVVAADSAKLIKAHNVKEQAVVVDFDINTLENKKIISGVDFEDLKNKVYVINPTPIHVNDLLIFICSLENLIEKCKQSE